MTVVAAVAPSPWAAAAVMLEAVGEGKPAAVSQIPPPPVRLTVGPCKLSVGLDDAGAIDPVIAPNGERVRFIRARENLLVELYSVPVNGGRSR